MNQINHCLKEKNKTIIGPMKDGLDEKMMTKFVKSRAKACSCLTDESNKDKKLCHEKKTCI